MSPEKRYTRAEALSGTRAPQEVQDAVELVDVPYCDFSGVQKTGQLVVHRAVLTEVRYIFEQLAQHKFPIAQVVPVVAYEWDDDVSMAANNTSAFNYRTIAGTDELSKHALGRAIDINPALNPYFTRDGRVLPPHTTYDVTRPGTIVSGGVVDQLFRQHGWTWGGNWTDRKDFHHFEKSA